MSVSVLKCCNAAAFAVDIFLNVRYGSGIGRLSAAYPHVAKPAGAAFAIWSLIFAWTLVFVLAQAFSGMFDKLLPSLTPWFCLAQLMQGAWVPAFTSSDPAAASDGGDVAFWLSLVLLVCTAPVFLKAVAVVSSIQKEQAYWISYGITINAAWILMAAGVSLNMASVAFRHSSLSTIAMIVLVTIVCVELWITGLVGNDPFDSPTAFLPVAAWALFWVCVQLGDAEHVARISPLYGSNFISVYRCCAALLFGFALGSQVIVVRRKKEREADTETSLMD